MFRSFILPYLGTVGAGFVLGIQAVDMVYDVKPGYEASYVKMGLSVLISLFFFSMAKRGKV